MHQSAAWFPAGLSSWGNLCSSHAVWTLNFSFCKLPFTSWPCMAGHFPQQPLHKHTGLLLRTPKYIPAPNPSPSASSSRDRAPTLTILGASAECLSWTEKGACPKLHAVPKTWLNKWQVKRVNQCPFLQVMQLDCRFCNHNQSSCSFHLFSRPHALTHTHFIQGSFALLYCFWAVSC